MPKTIMHQFYFKHPPEKVWKYLTEAELLSTWLMPNDFKPVVGHKFQFQTKPMPRFGFDGIVHCEVLEIITHKKLVYSWRGGSLDSVVEWMLIPDKNGTCLKLEHKGFKPIKNLFAYIMMGKGWSKIGSRIAQKLELEYS